MLCEKVHACIDLLENGFVLRQKAFNLVAVRSQTPRSQLRAQSNIPRSRYHVSDCQAIPADRYSRFLAVLLQKLPKPLMVSEHPLQMSAVWKACIRDCCAADLAVHLKIINRTLVMRLCDLCVAVRHALCRRHRVQTGAMNC